MSKRVLAPKASKTRKAGSSSSQSLCSLQNKITSTFLCMLNTIKIYHWNTDHYATHKATDQLYGDLNSKVDTFVETMLGKETVSTRHKVLKINSLKMSTYKSNKDFKKETEGYKSFLIGLTNNKLFNTPQNSDLMNMRDDILASLNQFLYLLTLH
jgi:DNA-binding ferritin-like protein